MRKSALLMSLAVAALTVGGCASSLTGDTYSRDEARKVQTVRMGTIEIVAAGEASRAPRPRSAREPVR